MTVNQADNIFTRGMGSKGVKGVTVTAAVKGVRKMYNYTAYTVQEQHMCPEIL